MVLVSLDSSAEQVEIALVSSIDNSSQPNGRRGDESIPEDSLLLLLGIHAKPQTSLTGHALSQHGLLNETKQALVGCLFQHSNKRPTP